MKKTDISKQAPSEIVLYQAEEGRFQLALSRDTDSIWLNLNQIAELYQTSVPNISMHIRKIFTDGELEPVSTVKKYLTVQTEKDRQVRRNINFYSLDMILAIGYKVRSKRGTQFRIWVTQHLSEFLKKGFVLDKQRETGGCQEEEEVKAYPKYKDSGIEWLGEVPEEWLRNRIKYVTKVLNGSTPSSSEPDYWDGDISWATPDDLGSLNSKYLHETTRQITKEGYLGCGT